ncbi:MAG: ankyrin repeat domain-containing protein [Pirellulales bacterium]
MTHNAPELINASLQGDLAEVQQLVESGADVNSIDQHARGPLLTFTPAVTEYLLAQGADPNLQTNENGTPMLAGIAYMNNVDCVRLLLKAGAKPNAFEPGTEETALHCSLARGSDVPTEGGFVIVGAWSRS